MRTNRSSSAMNTQPEVQKNNTKRAFGRDITNTARGSNTVKDVIKPTVFKVMEKSIATEKLVTDVAVVKDTRDYMRRSSDDIDARDTGNPLLCTEYVHNLYKYFNKEETLIVVDPGYIASTQTHVTEKMRTILVDWMVEVHIKYKQVPETLYLTIQLIDRYLQKRSVRRSKLQLIGVACLMVCAINIVNCLSVSVCVSVRVCLPVCLSNCLSVYMCLFN